MDGAGYVHVRGRRTEYEVADILRDHWTDYRAKYGATPEQARVVWALKVCRTPVLGGTVYECTACGAVEFAYRSCRDRHCPKCQKFLKAQWAEAQRALTLPVPYFHVVFTTDHLVNPWIERNRALLYNLLFETASATLKDFARREWGAEPGITSVLHTWGQTLQPHVHLHNVLTAGGLSLDGQRWVRCAPNYAFDIVAVSAAFRDRYCARLEALIQAGQLTGVTAEEAAPVLAAMRAKAWEVFIKPFDGPERVTAYLARYVQGVAIANTRLVNVTADEVTFSYYDNAHGGVAKEMTLACEEFIRRFVWHILPDGFVRVRHYGLHHAGARAKLKRARVILGLAAELPSGVKLTLAAWLQQMLGDDVNRCAYCGRQGTLVARWNYDHMPAWWLMWKIVCGTILGWWRTAAGTAD